MGRNYTHRCFISLVYPIQWLGSLHWAGSRMMEPYSCIVSGISYLSKTNSWVIHLQKSAAKKNCQELWPHFRLLPFTLLNFSLVRKITFIDIHALPITITFRLQSHANYKGKAKFYWVSFQSFLQNIKN